MKNNMHDDFYLKDLRLRRKCSLIIIAGGTLLVAFMMGFVEVFVTHNKDLMLIVLTFASVLSILPSVLKLVKINAIIKEKNANMLI